MVYKDENESGGKRNRPQLNKALEHIRKGDVLVVSKLDRLSRSMIDLLTILKQIDEARQRSAAWVKQSKRNPLPVG
jgi:DNA invertase Pin-like site-specific DNA recombinase